MMKEIATVVKVEAGKAWVQCERLGGCTACSAKTECGTNALGKLVKNSKDPLFEVTTLMPLKIGQQVEIALPEKSFFSSLMLLYGVPLIVLLLVTFLTQFLPEIFQGMAIISATFFSFFLVRFVAKKLQQKASYQVVLLKVLK